jgi:hypothetical protein
MDQIQEQTKKKVLKCTGPVGRITNQPEIIWSSPELVVKRLKRFQRCSSTLALYTVVCVTLAELTDLSFIPVQQSLGPVQLLRTALTMRLNSETNFKTYSMLRSILCIPPTRNRQ